MKKKKKLLSQYRVKSFLIIFYFLLLTFYLFFACSSSPDRSTPQNLIPFVRLNASDTRSNGILPWPRESEDAKTLSNNCRFILGNGKVAALLDEVIKLIPEDRGLKNIAQNQPVPTTCNTFEEITWAPFTGQGSLFVYGLSGAEIIDGNVHWTPAPSGKYEGIVVGLGAEKFKGWTFNLFNIVCESK